MWHKQMDSRYKIDCFGQRIVKYYVTGVKLKLGEKTLHAVGDEGKDSMGDNSGWTFFSFLPVC